MFELAIYVIRENKERIKGQALKREIVFLIDSLRMFGNVKTFMKVGNKITKTQDTITK